MFSPSPLVDSVVAGDINQAIIELNNNIDQEELDRGLYFASKNKDLPMVKLLLENGADINSKLIWGSITPLMGVVITTNKGDSTEVVRYLLNEGADPNSTTGMGYTALMLATNKSVPSLEVIKLLLKYGSNEKNKCLTDECNAEIDRHLYLKNNYPAIKLQSRQNSSSTGVVKDVWEQIYLNRDVKSVCETDSKKIGVLWAISEILDIPYDPSMTKKDLCKLFS